MTTLGIERGRPRARLSVSSRSDAKRPTKKAPHSEGAPRKRKITISLSEKSFQALEELRALTDADSDSEVFRNALRLHLTLARAHVEGVKLFMKRDGTQESVRVTLFAQGD